MTGGTDYKHRGLVPRAIAHLFHEIHQKTENAYTVRVSFLEIYNESIFDLLASVKDSSNNTTISDEAITVMEDPKGGVFVRGLSEHIANDEEEALSYMFEGDTNRAIAEHTLNKASSRSHCIFTIHLEVRSRVESEGKTIHSKLNLVDLAGSERVGKTNSDGQVLNEAK